MGHLEVSLSEVWRRPGTRLKGMLECKGRFDLAEPTLGYPVSAFSTFQVTPLQPLITHIVVLVVVVIIIEVVVI